MSRVLCLPASTGLGFVNHVFCNFSLVTRKIENAGQSFYDRFDAPRCGDSQQRTASDAACTESQNSADQSSTDNNAASDSGQKEQKSKKKLSAPTRLKKLVEGPNLYTVLQLDADCSTDAVKKAYRRLALEFHPDKQKARQNVTAQTSTRSNAVVKEGLSCASSASAERSGLSSCSLPSAAIELPGGFKKTTQEMFLLIQDAYEALIDPVFRRQYDSALPFDESIPSASDVDASDPSSFFNVFRPVFLANARWSSKKPVPDLGSLTTDMREVQRFYRFWEHFDSIRDFAIKDEYDIAEAECREERRWMERQNQKIRKKYTRDEKQRIVKLTHLAYTLDPRIVRIKEKETERREAMKEQKKKNVEAEREKKLALEKQKKKDAEAKAEAQALALRQETERRQLAKAKLKESRRRLREVCKSIIENDFLDAELVQQACLALPVHELDQLAALCESSEAKGGGGAVVASVLRNYLVSRNIVPPEPSCEAEAPLAETDDCLPVEWTAEELSAVLEAINKFPAGTPRRWQSIGRCVTTKPSRCVIEKAKQLATSSKKQPSHVASSPTSPASSESTASSFSTFIPIAV